MHHECGFLTIDPEAVAGGLDDSDICLVRNQKFYFVGSDLRLL